jgi:hypothetical protein
LAEHFAAWTPPAGRHREVAAVLAALALTGPAARRDDGTAASATLPTPWETLGAWRPGAGPR